MVMQQSPLSFFAIAQKRSTLPRGRPQGSHPRINPTHALTKTT
jgi:hypothetical protein